MPGPLVAAAGAALGSAAIGAHSASRASRAQQGVANDQIKLQKQQFKRMDEIQRQLFNQQSTEVNENYWKSVRAARDAEAAAQGNINALSGYLPEMQRLGADQISAIRASGAANINDFNRLYGNASGQIRDAQGRIISDATRTENRNIADVTGARDRIIDDALRTKNMNVTGINDARDRIIQDSLTTKNMNVRELRDARDRAIAGYDPYTQAGENALGAYQFNLGIGSQPSNYSGLELSPATRFLMEEGRREIEGGAAGAGGLYSGATLAALDERRMGLAAQDRDNQMAQLFGLVGTGLSATDARAGAERGFANDITGERNIFNTTRTGANQWGASAAAGERNIFNALRTGANQWGADAVTGIRDTATGLRTGANQWGANALSGLSTDLAGQLAGQRTLTQGLVQGTQDADLARRLGLSSSIADARTSASNALAANLIGLNQDRTSSMSAARNSRANLLGSASQNFTTGMSNALANLGDARAAGAVGVGNALVGGLNSGFNIYGLLGGQIPGAANSTGAPLAGTNLLSGLFR